MASQYTRNAEVGNSSSVEASNMSYEADGKEVAQPIGTSMNAESDLPVSPSEKVVGIEPPPNGGLTAWLQV